MQVRTLPLYSRLADPAEVPPEVGERLPPGWRLSRHQVETYRALTGGDADVILNIAMTGDGKSLAAYLPALTDGRWRAFGMYPTIELSRDQERQFERYVGEFRQPLPFCSLWGEKLARFAEAHEFKRRGEALKERFENHNVILTNPDIFNLVMNYRYDSLIFSDQELPYSLCTQFDYLVFDEFHVFAMPQIVAAITAMVYIQELERGRHRFLFSSATPAEALVEMVERSGLRWRIIGGSYDRQQSPEHRLVLYPATLYIERLGERQGVEDWLRENLTGIARFWQEQSPRPKAAVIVNSVAAARRISRMLEGALQPSGISVGENTGLTGAERRKDSLHRDIVVGTSTIDVGVDFNINLLLFEATNAGTFLQRLGRLGRCRRDEPGFERYEARAFISGKTPWIYERLVAALAERGIGPGDEVDRPTQLAECVREAFPAENEFVGYARRWGVLQAAHVVNLLDRKRQQGAYDRLAANLARRYEQAFGLSDFGKARRRYWYLTHESRRKESMPVVDEVLAFRGSSPFSVVCWDATVQPNALIAYDLLSLVQSATYIVVSPEAYYRATGQAGGDEERLSLKYVMKGRDGQPLVLKIVDFHAERETLKLKVSCDLSLLCDQVFVLRGLGIAEPTSVQLPGVNDVLKRQAVVCYATRWDPRELRRMLRLPAHLPLYTAVDVHRNRSYTLAFSKSALMLEAQLIGWRKKSVEDEAIIC